MASQLSAERAARNESVFRDANERIEQRLGDLSLLDERAPFLCECEDPLCARALRLTVEEYEAVRAHADRFIVAPGHSAGSATIVETHGGHLVVAKEGEEGALARELDPRRSGT